MIGFEDINVLHICRTTPSMPPCCDQESLVGPRLSRASCETKRQCSHMQRFTLMISYNNLSVQALDQV